MAAVGYATLVVIPSLRGVQREISAQVKSPLAKAGKEAGEKLSKSLAGGVKSSEGAVKRAFAGVEKATERVAAAESKVEQQRHKSLAAAKNLEAAEARLEAARASGSAEQIARAEAAVESRRAASRGAADALVKAESDLAARKKQHEQASERLTAAQKRLDDANTRNTSSLAKLDRAFAGVESTAEKASKSFGGFGDKLKKSLTVGAAAAGAAAGGVLATSMAKGFKRLDALDQAQAKMRGLGYDAAEVSSLMDSVSKSVKGTAFGLDEAAGSAAKLGAVGVATGAEMDRAMKLTADIAAQAGTNMDDISSIMAKIAGAGKVTGETLAQLDDRATGAAAALAEHLGVSIEEVRAKVSRGQVDFATFQEAMEKHLGGAALATGETFKGAMDNMASAMGRFGQKLLAPAFTSAPVVFGAIGASFDSLGEAVAPASERIGEVLAPAMESFAGVIEQKIAPALGGLSEWLGDIAVKVTEVAVDPALWAAVGGVFESLRGAAQQLGPALGELAGHLVEIGKTISVATWGAFAAALDALAPLVGLVLVPLAGVVAKLAAENPGAVQAVVTAFLGFKAVGALAGPVAAFAGSARSMIGVVEALSAGGGLVGKLGALGGVAGKAAPLVGKLGGAFKLLGAAVMGHPIIAAVAGVAAGLTWFFTKTETGQQLWAGFVEVLSSGWDWLVEKFTAGVDMIGGAFSAVVDWFSGVGAAIGDAAGMVGDWFAGVGTAVSEWLAGVGSAVSEFFAPLRMAVGEALDGVVELAKDTLAVGWLALVDIFTGNWAQLGETLSQGFEHIVQRVQIYGEIVGTYLGDFFGNVGAMFSGLVSAVWEKLSAWAAAAVAVWESLKAQVGEKVGALVDGVAFAWENLKTATAEKFEALKAAAVSKAIEVKDGVSARFRELSEQIPAFFAELPSKIKSIFADAGEWLKDAGRRIIDGLLDGLKNAWRNVATWFSDRADDVRNWFSSTTSSAEARVGRSAGGQVPGYAGGGYLRDIPGIPRTVRDPILGVNAAGEPVARVEPGEFVINREATRKNFHLLAAINDGRITAKTDLGLPRYAEGGLVGFDDVIKFLKGQTVNGNPTPGPLEGFSYAWAGGLDANWGDCSGTQSAAASLIVGLDTTGRKFYTGDQGAWALAHGFQRGRGPGKNAYEMGFFNGGPYGGHTAGTLFDANGNSINFEMGGARGNGQLGGPAAGSRDPQFTDIYWHPLAGGSLADTLGGVPSSTSVDGLTVKGAGGTSATIDWGTASGLVSQWEERNRKKLNRQRLWAGLFDTGGVLPPGGFAYNASGEPEIVINGPQLKVFDRLAKNLGALTKTLGRQVEAQRRTPLPGTNIGAFFAQSTGREIFDVLASSPFGELFSWATPAVNAFGEMEDAWLAQRDAAKALGQAERQLAEARASGDTAKIKQAEDDLATARGVVGEAARAAGLAEVQMIFAVISVIGRLFQSIAEAQYRAKVGAAQAIATWMKYEAEWAALLDKQREAVGSLRVQQVEDLIRLQKAQWDVRLAQADVSRAQLEGVKTVAEAEARLAAERDRVARKATYNFNDLSLAYDRYRWVEKQGMIDRLKAYSVVTPEILALEHEVNVAKLNALRGQREASLAALEASWAQQKAALDLAQTQQMLMLQTQQLAAMQAQYGGMGQADAIYGSRTAGLYAERAQAQGRSNKGLLGWIGSFITNPIGTLKYAFGGGLRADREYAKYLTEEIERREAEGKGLGKDIDPKVLAQIQRLYAAGLTEQAENLIKMSQLGAPNKALEDAKEAQAVLDIESRKAQLAQSIEQSKLQLKFESQVASMRAEIEALKAGAASEQYRADYQREKNPAVKEALKALAEFESDRSREYAGVASGEKTVVEINVPYQETYTREQLLGILDGFKKVEELDVRVTELEAGPRPSAADLMGVRV